MKLGQDELEIEREQLAGTLGVAPDCSVDELRTTYKNLAKIHHPDRGGDADFMKVLSEAHDRLIELHDTDISGVTASAGEGWEWVDQRADAELADGGLGRTVVAAVAVLAALVLVVAAVWFLSAIR